VFEIEEDGVYPTIKMILHSRLDHGQVHRILDVENVLGVDGGVHGVVERLRDGQRHDFFESFFDSLTFGVATNRIPLFRTWNVEAVLQLLLRHLCPVLDLCAVSVQSLEIPRAQVLLLVVVPVDEDGEEWRSFRAFVVLHFVDRALPPLVVNLAADAITCRRK